MLGWIFKKKTGEPPAPALAAKVAAPRPVVDAAARLAQAQGDAAALLALARDTDVPLAQRQAAIDALQGEAALKQAEREFRNHDRRLHQAAKRRLQAKVAARQAREEAAQLIAAARRLVGEDDVPVNQTVELDRAWQALDAGALEAAQQQEFSALSAQLVAQWRQRSELEVQRKRRGAELAQALPTLQSACRAAAEGLLDRAAFDAARQAAQAVADAPSPEGAAINSALAGLRQALETAAALDAALLLLDPPLADPDPDDATVLAACQALPPDLAALLQARHARWRQQRSQQQQAQRLQQRDQARERQQAALAEAVALAEAALEAGQLAKAQRHLAQIDHSPPTNPLPEALQARIAAAQARLAQLRGWQHWSGGRARDELVLQAEALAAATVADAGAADPEVARLSVKQRAEIVGALRERWKEIDHLGGTGGHALWQRFDTALKAAYEPVAAHQAARRAARESNLAARQQLLDALEALTTPADRAQQPSADVRTLAAALERFQIGWRKLGPLEHTVPRAAQATLAQRLAAAVSRAEQPLHAARGSARAGREALLARARELAASGPGRDLVGQARALQADWQAQAKALPLARADEQALWAAFKTAIDAAFAARQQAFDARDAEFESHAAERLALIERLQLRPDESPAAQRRLLAEVDAAWNCCGPAPRARRAALEAEYRTARQRIQQWLDSAAEREWQACCHALEAKHALCLAREQGAADGAALAASWQALPALPAALEAALARRAGLRPPLKPAAGPGVDELLLLMETAWSLPTPPRFEAARRERRLLAMKAALEGRRSAETPPPPEQALAALLEAAGLDDVQSERLAAVLAAWRQRGPRHAPAPSPRQQTL